MWPIIIGYIPGMEEGSGDEDDEQIMTTTRHRYDYDKNIRISRCGYYDMKHAE